MGLPRKGKLIQHFRRAWKTACLAAGFAELVSEKPRVIKVHRIPHDFRRTAVRNLERAGVSRSAAMKMVGHRTESIYQRARRARRPPRWCPSSDKRQAGVGKD